MYKVLAVYKLVFIMLGREKKWQEMMSRGLYVLNQCGLGWPAQFTETTKGFWTPTTIDPSVVDAIVEKHEEVYGKKQ